MGGKQKEVSKGAAVWCITLPIVMASSEAGMMVHGYIFRTVEETTFFIPNRKGGFFDDVQVCCVHIVHLLFYLLKCRFQPCRLPLNLDMSYWHWYLPKYTYSVATIITNLTLQPNWGGIYVLYQHFHLSRFPCSGRLSTSCMTEALPRFEIYMRENGMARHFRTSHYDCESEHSPQCWIIHAAKVSA